MAASTRSSRIPRPRSCSSTMRARCCANSSAIDASIPRELAHFDAAVRYFFRFRISRSKLTTPFSSRIPCTVYSVLMLYSN